MDKIKNERYEFRFKFADFVKDKFPELDKIIHQKTDKWKSETTTWMFPTTHFIRMD